MLGVGRGARLYSALHLSNKGWEKGDGHWVKVAPNGKEGDGYRECGDGELGAASPHSQKPLRVHDDRRITSKRR